jgi:hypothetical protein
VNAIGFTPPLSAGIERGRTPIVKAGGEPNAAALVAPTGPQLEDLRSAARVANGRFGQG